MNTVAEFFDSLPPSAGSPHGLSFLTKAHECGERAARMQEPDAPAITSGPGADRGVLFHALWERHLPVDTPEGDLSEGPRKRAWILYRAYCEFWHSPEERFGCQLVGTELDFEWNGVTGRADRLMTVADPAKLLEFGVLLPVGSMLIHDFKTADSRKSAAYYMHGLQGRYYPQIWNAGRRRPLVAGILFDEVIDHVVPRKVADKKGSASYNVYWTPEAIEPEPVLVSLVEWSTEADARIKKRTRNRAACVSVFGEVCPFFNDCHKGL